MNHLKFANPLYWLLLFTVLLSLECCRPDTSRSAQKNWVIGPFTKLDKVNPCLLPDPGQVFLCPIRRDTVQWEIKDVFNPATAVRDDTIYMIYRAEDSVGRHNGTSRLGLAWSDDGRLFHKRPQPVLFPSEDLMKMYEWEGGIEDPRIVESPEGRYIMTYTAYDGQTARLCTASSDDLITWTKHGLAFNQAYNGKYNDTWSKSGSIIATNMGSRLVATPINGQYWMYWGDKHLYAATSENLIHWTPVEENDELKIVMSYRPEYFDSDLVEPGPPAMILEKGIVMIYNARNYGPGRRIDMEEGTYSAGQVLFSLNNPLHAVDRTDEPFFIPDRPYEISGQVNKVVFIEALAPLNNEWLIYYGTADSKIGVAAWPVASR